MNADDEALVDALSKRIYELTADLARAHIRISDLLHIIEMGQRFGSLCSFDTERLERVQREYPQ